jgi:hypothetical protein
MKSGPCAGVTLNDVAVPELWEACADLEIAAVLSLFALDILAFSRHENQRHKKKGFNMTEETYRGS